jgi:hypothetical protein
VSSGVPSLKDFDEATTVTCDHIVNQLVQFFARSSPFIILERATCNSGSNVSFHPLSITFEMYTIFSQSSLTFPDGQDDIDAIISVSFQPPLVDDLIDNLNGGLLPTTNPFSGTMLVVYTKP